MNAGKPLKLLPNLINSLGKLVGHPPQLSRPSSLFSICEVLPHLFIAGYAVSELAFLPHFLNFNLSAVNLIPVLLETGPSKALTLRNFKKPPPNRMTYR